MKVMIEGGVFGEMFVCDHITACQMLTLISKLKPVKQEYVAVIGYTYTLKANRDQRMTFTILNDNAVKMPDDLKELVLVKRELEADKKATPVIEDAGENTEASRTDTDIPF